MFAKKKQKNKTSHNVLLPIVAIPAVVCFSFSSGVVQIDVYSAGEIVQAWLWNIYCMPHSIRIAFWVLSNRKKTDTVVQHQSGPSTVGKWSLCGGFTEPEEADIVIVFAQNIILSDKQHKK